MTEEKERKTPPPSPNTPADPAQSPKPAPGGKPPVDWLRSKPVRTPAQTGTQPRRLDLGRHDVWENPGTTLQPRQTGSSGTPPQKGAEDHQASTEGESAAKRRRRRNRNRNRPAEGGSTNGSDVPATARPGTASPDSAHPGTTGYNRPPRVESNRLPTGDQGYRPGGAMPPRTPYSPGTGPGGISPRPYAPRPAPPSRPSPTAVPFAGGPRPDSRRARPPKKGRGNRERREPDLLEQEKLEAERRGKGTRADSLRTRIETFDLTARQSVAEPALTTERSREIEIPQVISVKDLAEAMGISSVEVIKALIKNGVMATVNQLIDFDTAAIVASDLGFEARPQAGVVIIEEPETAPTPGEATSPRRRIQVIEENPQVLKSRPPVVTIMGHVDHGKTTLLDAIRRTNVAGGEAGGITQHIGAYQVEDKGQKITFLDTPGHAAFTAMRARGAQMTDVAVLVVAADDGVQPQTLEALNHARAANIPIVVALNKIDKDNANPERVKQQLSDAGLVPEEWGGDTIVVPVSAKKGIGLTDLLDSILIVAELQELKANPDRLAIGTIIEARLDKSKGPVATVLVQHGTLKVGDHVVVGSIYGKVRAMFNDKGKAIKSAGPSVPVEILGLAAAPEAGDILEAQPDERTARALAAQRLERRQAETGPAPTQRVTLDDLFSQIRAGAVKELNIILKADVQGSIEPIVNTLTKLSDEQVQVKIIHQGIGAINESDIMLAIASKAIVIGFNVEVDAAAKRSAEVNSIEVLCFKVIYDIAEAVQKAMKGLYEARYEEVEDGRAEVRATFKAGKNVIAGLMVTEGKLLRSSSARVQRDGTVLFDGRIGSLRHFKEDVREVTANMECGCTIEGFNDFQVGDVIICHHKERVG